MRVRAHGKLETPARRRVNAGPRSSDAGTTCGIYRDGERDREDARQQLRKRWGPPGGRGFNQLMDLPALQSSH